MKKTGEETITPIKNMKIIQRNDFQNFTLDSVLLSDFVKINRKTKNILDIGTGCGIIALLLAQRSKAQIKGIELQKTMAEIAERNVENNKFENQVKIINEDIKNYKNIFNRDEFDTIVTNPPYFEFTGDISQTNDLEQLANARHNINLSLEEIIKISSYLLKNMGSFSITKWNENSKICLLEAIKDTKKGFSVEMPIFVYDENGQKNEYIENLYKS